MRVWGGDGVRVVRDLGELAVPSGKLLVGDPLELPFAPRIPVTAATCKISLALVRMFGIHEVAAVRADFGRGPVRRWRKQRKGCAIDSATACVADAGLLAGLQDEKQDERLTARWERFAAGSRTAQRVRIADRDVVLFQVHDDGCYAVWKGINEGGSAVAAVVLWRRSALSTPP